MQEKAAQTEALLKTLQQNLQQQQQQQQQQQPVRREIDLIQIFECDVVVVRVHDLLIYFSLRVLCSRSRESSRTRLY